MRLLLVLLLTLFFAGSNGAAGSSERSGEQFLDTDFAEFEKLTPSPGASQDFFGYSVAVSGHLAIVGAYGDDQVASAAGAAYIFGEGEGGPSNWGQIEKLVASPTASGDYFGYSVAISGDTAVVGANHADAPGLASSGAAYVFARNQGGTDNWGQVKKLTAGDRAADDQFGYSVAISGDTVVVGSPWDDDDGSASGSAYVFQRDKGGANNWGQVEKLTASDAAMNDHLGFSVAISGDHVVAGAPWNTNSENYAGAAYVFARDKDGTDKWGEVEKLFVTDGTPGDYLGHSVAISGGTAVAGAYHYTTDTGAAYVFDRNHGGLDNWGLVKRLIGSDTEANDQFGWSVAVSGDRVIAGAHHDDAGGNDSGSAYMFRRDRGGANNWGETQKLTASDAAADDWFGGAVAMAGSTVVVGAYANDDAGSFSGTAYVFGAPFLEFFIGDPPDDASPNDEFPD
jgi:hypothetical protein